MLAFFSEQIEQTALFQDIFVQLLYSLCLALQRNLNLCIPRKGIARPLSNFHIHVSVSDISTYILYFPAAE
jgi:hypothetical protein